MDHVEIAFFGLALLLTLAAGFFFYILLYEAPEAPFPVSKTAKLGDFEIHYQMMGQGMPILLIHGLGASLHCWHSLVPLLATQFKVIALDLPGFGGSSKLIGHNYGLDEQAERIEQFLVSLDIEECYLVGNSMGGNLALWLAHRSPARFPSVVAIAPAAHPKLVPWITNKLGFLSRPASWMLAKPLATYLHRRTLGHVNQLNEQFVNQTLSIYRKNPIAIRTFLAATRAISDPRILSESFESRVLVLWGEADKIVPRWAIDALMPRLSNATLVIHRTGGHQLQHDDAEWTAKKILDFLPSRLAVERASSPLS